MKSIAELGLLSDLHELELDGNAFTGSLPTELGLINGTRLRGILLDDWTLMMNFSFNDLSGVVPEELCRVENDGNNNTIVDLDCGPDICGCSSCECNNNATEL